MSIKPRDWRMKAEQEAMDAQGVQGPPRSGKSRQGKKKRQTSADVEERARRDSNRIYADQERQRAQDVEDTQKFSILTDGASQQITKNGVRQRGMSDAEAGARIRQDRDLSRPSTATVNPNATAGAGRGRKLGSVMAGGGGGGADPYNPTGFRSSNASPGGKTFTLRTRAEQAARIADSHLPQAGKAVFSTKGRDQGAKGGDFTTAESEAYANKARVMYGGSAKFGATPSAPAAGAASTAANRPFDRSGSGERITPASTPPPASPAPAPRPAPTAIKPDLTTAPSGAAPTPGPSASPPPPSPSPAPASAAAPARYGQPGYKTDAQYATGMTPQLTLARQKLNAQQAAIDAETTSKRTPTGVGNAYRKTEGQRNEIISMDRSISAIARRNAPMQSEQMSMTAQGLPGPPRAAMSGGSQPDADPFVRAKPRAKPVRQLATAR
jgi:hypothetical protein